MDHRRFGHLPSIAHDFFFLPKNKLRLFIGMALFFFFSVGRATTSIPGTGKSYTEGTEHSQVDLLGNLLFSATDTLFIRVTSMEPFDTCLSTDGLPGGFASASVVYGPLNNTGILTVNANDSCVQFLADAGVVGDFVDVMSVALCDPTSICDTFVLVLSIDPPPCPVYYSGDDFIQVENCDSIVALCMEGGDVSSVGALSVMDNGETYSGPLRGCNIDSTIYYLNLRFDDPGNYVLIKWGVNGDTLRNISFNNLQELADALSNFDPNATWTVDGSILTGGDPYQSYGDLFIEESGVAIRPEPARLLTQANGISIELDTGIHEIMIVNTRTLCSDTFSVTISCQPPFFADSLLSVYEDQTISYCLESGQLDTITSINNVCPDNSGTNVDWTPLVTLGCVELSGEQLGQDTFCFEFCDAISDTCIIRNVIVKTLPLPDTINREIIVGFTDTICLDTTIFSGRPDTFFNFCPVSGGTAADFQLDNSTYCVYYTGLTPGVNTACLVLCDEAGQCDTTTLIVSTRNPIPDTAFVSVEVGEFGSFCVDTSELVGTVVALNDICLSGVGTFTDFLIHNDSFCVSYEGIVVGVDTFCLLLCDDSSVPLCDTTVLVVSVSAPQVAGPLAIDDFTIAMLDTRKIINVLANDTLRGDLIDILVITPPLYGEVLVNPDFTLDYTPDENTCDVTDTFDYVLVTTAGQDTATVSVSIECEGLRIFSGFSPNRDGVNDTWQILGIEDFPNNEVVLFNRWGNQVFTAKGYQNTNAWDGTWSGKDLPDGVYFYLIKDGEGNTYDGYVRLHR